MIGRPKLAAIWPRKLVSSVRSTPSRRACIWQPIASPSEFVFHDGSLTIGQISSLPLADCRLAVLSACRTSEGPEVSGEMAMSVTRAFLVAGASRVVASQWNVADEAGCEFVQSFLTNVASQWTSGQFVQLCRRDDPVPARSSVRENTTVRLG